MSEPGIYRLVATSSSKYLLWLRNESDSQGPDTAWASQTPPKIWLRRVPLEMKESRQLSDREVSRFERSIR